MTAKTILTLAAVIAAATAFITPAAEAGGGVRLGFGGPLGSFVARPTQGYYTPSYGRRSYGSPSCDKPKYGAVRSYARPMAKKPAAVASRHDDDDTPARSKKKSASSKSAEKSETFKQFATNAIPLEATATAKPVVTTPPAADLNAAAKIENSAVSTNAAATAKKVESAALVPANATIVDAAPVAKTEPKTETKESKKTEKKVEKKSDCRRFVPSAGITISVRCND